MLCDRVSACVSQSPSDNEQLTHLSPAARPVHCAQIFSPVVCDVCLCGGILLFAVEKNLTLVLYEVTIKSQ